MWTKFRIFYRKDELSGLIISKIIGFKGVGYLNVEKVVLLNTIR